MRHEATPPFRLSGLVRGAIAQQQLRTGMALEVTQDEQIQDIYGLEYAGNEGKVIAVTSSADGLETVESVSVTTGATVTRVAGEALGGNRAVRIADDNKAYYADPDETARLTIGLTTGAVVLGASASIQVEGEMEEPSWSWSDDEVIWLAADGMLTQTVPTSGHLFKVGIPMGPTRMRIEPQLIAKIS